MTLEVYETWIDRSHNAGIGDSDWYEPFTDDLGELYRAFRSEYGGGVVRMYADIPVPDAQNPVFPATPIESRRRTTTEHVGWVFTQRVQYDDSDETFVRETWVEFRQN